VPSVLVIGGGIFGVTAALAMRARGWSATIVDRAPPPHPLAESTDISKVIRIDYGADEDYTIFGEQALDGWRRWNAAWPRPLFHETGVMFVARAPMTPGGFEHDSFDLLSRRGHRLERLDDAAIARRFPAFATGIHVDGYFNPIGGWAESSAVVSRLASEASDAGISVRSATVSSVGDGGAVVDGAFERADRVIVCCGAWTRMLVPELAPSLRAIGQPVFHLRPDDRIPFEPARFPVFGADLARTGYYGFPITSDGVIKIANHGIGRSVDDDRDRVVTDGQESDLRNFLREVFPSLSTAPIVQRRLCVYCDTVDGNFWIAPHPDRPGVVIAAGGSGHAFKFAPVIGDAIAAITVDDPHPLRSKFAPRDASAIGREAARHSD
jgi:glycine/D-amino acid oxidase-like deaminating enzyme